MSAPPDTPTRVGIAVVEFRGRYLVGDRPLTGPLAGYSEFPGGKCLQSESAAACAVRECLEETGLHVRTIDLLMHRTFEYPHGQVDLQFWLCRPTGTVQLQAVYQGYRWVPASDLPSLRFPEANFALIQYLAQPRRE